MKTACRVDFAEKRSNFATKNVSRLAPRFSKALQVPKEALIMLIWFIDILKFSSIHTFLQGRLVFHSIGNKVHFVFANYTLPF